jgi:hypothetical protein
VDLVAIPEHVDLYIEIISIEKKRRRRGRGEIYHHLTQSD